MSRVFNAAMIIAIYSLAQGAYAACYTIYKNDVAIYQSSVAPVDMGSPFSQTVPTKFGEGATMVYQEWANSCAEFDTPTRVGQIGTVAGQTKVQERTSAALSSRVSSLSRPAEPAPIPIGGSAMANNGSLGDGSAGGTAGGVGYSGVIQTGPRGGQYYINPNGNKTYTSSGSSGRSGRR
jgi:hypothetical protein